MIFSNLLKLNKAWVIAPSFSQRFALGEALNLVLLKPSGRNIVISDEGILFYKKALEFLKSEELLFQNKKVSENRLRLGTFEVFSTHLIEDKLPRDVVFNVDMMESGLALARQGHAAIFIPHFVARSMNLILKSEFTLHEIPFPPRVKLVRRNIYLAQRGNQLESSLVRTIAKLIRSECLNDE